MAGGYALEKTVWDDGDFDRMGWHDVTVHAIAFAPDDFELSFDIDYMFQWVHPQQDEKCFRFWISPCTLVFSNVYDLQFVQSGPHRWEGPKIQINELTRTNPSEVVPRSKIDETRPENVDHSGLETEWQWTLDCWADDREITFRSTGFRQFVRRFPLPTFWQELELPERGGYSFDRSYRDGLPVPEAVFSHARELLLALLHGQADILEALADLKDLCVRYGYNSELFDFYHLFLAHADLQTHGEQQHWPGATQENIGSIVLQCAEEFVQSRPEL